MLSYSRAARTASRDFKMDSATSVTTLTFFLCLIGNWYNMCYDLLTLNIAGMVRLNLNAPSTRGNHNMHFQANYQSLLNVALNLHAEHQGLIS